MSEIRTSAIESVYLTPAGERRSAKQRRQEPEATQPTQPADDEHDLEPSSTQDSPSTSPLSIDVLA